MYKDKEKQKEANRTAMRKKRQGITKKSCDTQTDVIPSGKLYVYGEGGGRISLEKLIDPEWRELFVYLKEHLREDLKEDLRIGIEGVTVKELDRLVEITA